MFETAFINLCEVTYVFSVFSLSCNLLGLRLCIPLDPVSSYIAMSFLEKGGLLFFQLKSNIRVNPG